MCYPEAHVDTVLALSKRNTNAAEIIIFLHRLTQVLVEYFKELEEESIRDNFVIIYELMDEMMDFGFPQTTESKILQEYITQESHKLEIQVRPPMAVTNAVSWRTEGIRYRKNEVFLDVIESVNMLVCQSLQSPYASLTPTLYSPGKRERQCCKIRDFGCREDEVLLVRDARTTAGPERQGYV